MTIKDLADCGGPWLAIVVVIVLVVWAKGMNNIAAATDPKPYHIKIVYTMDDCPPCERLKAYLRKHGFTTAITFLREQPEAVDFFPTVYYTDGFFDNGQRVLNGECRLPEKAIEQIHLMR